MDSLITTSPRVIPSSHKAWEASSGALHKTALNGVKFSLQPQIFSLLATFWAWKAPQLFWRTSCECYPCWKTGVELRITRGWKGKGAIPKNLNQEKNGLVLTWDWGRHQSPNPALSVLLSLVYVLQDTEGKVGVMQWNLFLGVWTQWDPGGICISCTPGLGVVQGTELRHQPKILLKGTERKKCVLPKFPSWGFGIRTSGNGPESSNPEFNLFWDKHLPQTELQSLPKPPQIQTAFQI